VLRTGANNGIARAASYLAIKKVIAPAKLLICASPLQRRHVKRLGYPTQPIALNCMAYCHA